MNKIERLLQCESVMIRKDFHENLQLEIAASDDMVTILRRWCENEDVINITNHQIYPNGVIDLQLNNNGEEIGFDLTTGDFVKYFIGHGLITTGNTVDVVDYIDEYGNLIYEGEYSHDDIKYDIMELAYDLEIIDEPTAEQYLMFGKKFIERTISKGVVKNIPYTQLIEGGETIQQVQVLTDINYMAIGESISRIIEDHNVRFFEK